MEYEEQKDPAAQSTSVYLTTSAADFSKETLVVKEEETYDAGVFERVKAEVVKLLKELKPQSLVEPPPGSSISPPGSSV